MLISLFSDDFNSVPKYFSLKNKGFIRNVLLLHISDCDDPIETLKGTYVRSSESSNSSFESYTFLIITKHFVVLCCVVLCCVVSYYSVVCCVVSCCVVLSCVVLCCVVLCCVVLCCVVLCCVVFCSNLICPIQYSTPSCNTMLHNYL